MLRFALAFLVIAAIAGVFCFGLFTDYSWLGAKIVFFIFLALALATWLGGTFGCGRTRRCLPPRTQA